MNLGLKVFDHLFEGDGFTVRKSGFVDVSADVTTEQLGTVIQNLKSLNESTSQLRRVVAVAIGSLVLEHSARTRSSLAESVDVLGICKDYDVAKKTVLKWAKVVSVLPDAVLELPNLHMTHFDAAVSFAGPENHQRAVHFNRERDALLQEVSEDPGGKGKRFIEDRMKALKVKYGVKVQRQESISHILKKLVWGFRIMRLKREIRAEVLERAGLTEPDLWAYIRSWEDELIVRKQIPTDVVLESIPWHAKDASENQTEER